jgi:hypothetical protein
MSIKQQERSVSDPRYDRMRRSKTSLREKMSEIISLREQVAQAELAAHLLRSSIADVKDRSSERSPQ